MLDFVSLKIENGEDRNGGIEKNFNFFIDRIQNILYFILFENKMMHLARELR